MNLRYFMLEDIFLIPKSVPQAIWLDQDSMFTINLWLYGVVMKLVPCLVLGVVTVLLVHEMYKVSPKIY